jgi:hypothetical protein
VGTILQAFPLQLPELGGSVAALAAVAFDGAAPKAPDACKTPAKQRVRLAKRRPRKKADRETLPDGAQKSFICQIMNRA